MWSWGWAFAVLAGLISVIFNPSAAVFPAILAVGYFLRSAALLAQGRRQATAAGKT